MLYARDLIEVMRCYPNRRFRMAELVLYAADRKKLDPKGRDAARKAVARALDALGQAGHITVTPPVKRGGFALYRWKSGT